MTKLTQFNDTLTDEQKNALSYLDWDDETLGKFVRVISEQIQDDDGLKSSEVTSICYNLIDLARKHSGDAMIIKMDDINIGNWEIKIECTKKPTGIVLAKPN